LRVTPTARLASAESRSAASINASVIHKANALDFPVRQAPDVLQDHIGFDAVDNRERTVQAVAHRRRHRWCEWRNRVLEDVHAVPAPVRLFREQAGALQRPMLERELRGRTHLRLEFLESRKGLHEQLMHTFTAVGVV
jgi:hypothetical protein